MLTDFKFYGMPYIQNTFMQGFARARTSGIVVNTAALSSGVYSSRY